MGYLERCTEDILVRKKKGKMTELQFQKMKKLYIKKIIEEKSLGASVRDFQYYVN